MKLIRKYKLIIVLLGFLLACNFVSAQTIYGTPKWQWHSGNYIDPINNATVSTTDLIINGHATGTDLYLYNDLEVAGNATTTGSTYAGTSLGLSTEYINQWSDLSAYITTGQNDWIFTGTDAITPTTSVGLYVSSPSSTFQGNLRVDGNSTTTGTGTFNDVYIPSMDGDTTYRTVNDWWKLFTSAGRIAGGELSDNGSLTVAIAEGTGVIRIADDDVSQVKFIDWVASTTGALAINEVRYFGVEYNGGNERITFNTDNVFDLDTDFPLGSVVNQAGTLYFNNNPFWTSDAITNVIETFQSFEYIRRDNYVGGLIIGVTGTRNPTLTGGTLWSRMTENAIPDIDCSGTDEFYAWWRDGAGGWTRGETASSTYLVTRYDDNSGNPIELNNNKYANFWVWTTLDGQLMLIYPQNQYVASSLAETEEVPVFPTSWYEHGELLGRILFKKDVDTPIAVQSVYSTVFSAAQAADHTNLSNLAWTSSGHTGTANNFAGFDGAGAATYYPEANYGALASDESVTGTWTFDWLSATTSLQYWWNTTTTWAGFSGQFDTYANASTTIGNKSYSDLEGSPSDRITAGDNLTWDGDTLDAVAGGDVDGPASATDNAIATFHLTTGKIIQNSAVIIDDSDNITGVTTLGIDDGLDNIFIGQTLPAGVTTGYKNVGVGVGALRPLTSGNENMAIGNQALYDLQTGLANVAVGQRCLYNLVTGSYNVAFGRNTLYYQKEGDYNFGIGSVALFNLISGSNNVAIGPSAMTAMKYGGNNTVIGGSGAVAMTPTFGVITSFEDYGGTVAGTVKANSEAHGLSTGNSRIIADTANYNAKETVTVIDVDSFYFTATWVADETGAWYNQVEATENTIIGRSAGNDLITGSYNVLIGDSAGFDIDTDANNQLWIDNKRGSTPLIYGDFSTGYVAIGGYTSPAEALEIIGNASTTGNLYAGGFASTTAGLFTQGDSHIGGNLTVDGTINGADICFLNGWCITENFKLDKNYKGLTILDENKKEVFEITEDGAIIKEVHTNKLNWLHLLWLLMIPLFIKRKYV